MINEPMINEPMINEPITKEIMIDQFEGVEKPFDIRDRTFLFAVQIVKITDAIPDTTTGRVLAHQLVKSGTSVGANVEEANGSESRQDFIHKMKIALKEAQETRYWLKIIKATKFDSPDIAILIQESDELVRILNSIISKTKCNR